LKHRSKFLNRRVIRNAVMATAFLAVATGAGIRSAPAHANHGQAEGKQSGRHPVLTSASETAVRNQNLHKRRAMREKLFSSVGLSERRNVKSFSESDVSGIASVYTDKDTASGEPMDPAAMTAAHRTLPFGTEVTVVNRDKGRSAVVRINDRGPYVQGRVIDLSPTAAQALGVDGLASVSLIVDGDKYAPQTGPSLPTLHLLTDLQVGVSQQHGNSPE
jgi:rare lipoprotein A